jgi:hypothetical protein
MVLEPTRELWSEANGMALELDVMGRRKGTETKENKGETGENGGAWPLLYSAGI